MSDEEDRIKMCIICGKIFVPSGIMKSITGDSIKNLIKASVRRRDKKDQVFERLQSIDVHDLCYNSYTSESHIIGHLRQLESTASTSAADDVPSSSGSDFEFTNLCFICGKDASDAFIQEQKKKPESQRVAVLLVEDDDGKLRQNILSKEKYAVNESSKEVILRILRVEDLHAVQARYHDNCLLILNWSLEKETDLPVLEASDRVISYILKNKKDGHYSIGDILKNFQCQSGLYDPERVRKSLKKISSDLFVTHDRDDLLTSYSTADNILTNKWYSKKYNINSGDKKNMIKCAAKMIQKDLRRELCCNSAENFSPDSDQQVPSTLSLLLTEIIKMEDDEQLSPSSVTEVNVIAQMIISAVRSGC